MKRVTNRGTPSVKRTKRKRVTDWDDPRVPASPNEPGDEPRPLTDAERSAVGRALAGLLLADIGRTEGGAS
jgi:hypothetical protein